MDSDNSNQPKLTRRRFVGKLLPASVGTPLLLSIEERTLLAKEDGGTARSGPTPLPFGKIGNVSISRLICGGNLISGYAHSRDLIYVSSLLTHYFTDEKIIETWAKCEQHGINTMVAFPGDPNAIRIYRKYRAQGGRIQYLAQLNPTKDDLSTCVKRARDVGAVGGFLLGNLGDEWTRDGSIDRIGELIELIRKSGMIAGVAGHELHTPEEVEKAGISPDFYVKTLHSDNYWTKRRPDQKKDVIDNYDVDNYWCVNPAETISYMAGIKKPWIAYKVLAAGAIHPLDGFRYAFENGADFVLAGMFDFQVQENASMANEILKSLRHRQRPWLA